jgi:hypothetical protein
MNTDVDNRGENTPAKPIRISMAKEDCAGRIKMPGSFSASRQVHCYLALETTI